MSNDFTTKASADIETENLTREELLKLLHDISEQRDAVLSQFEAMAFQTDASAREITEAKLEECYEAKRAADSERHAEQEAAYANELLRQLNEERSKCAAITTDFARFRDAMERAPVDAPWTVLGRAALQIISNGVAWARAKIPADSPLLPWFDRAVELAKTTGRLLFVWSKSFLVWMKPHAINFWRSLRSEVVKRMSKARVE